MRRNFVLHPKKAGKQKISNSQLMYANDNQKIFLNNFFGNNELCDFQVIAAKCK